MSFGTIGHEVVRPNALPNCLNCKAFLPICLLVGPKVEAFSFLLGAPSNPVMSYKWQSHSQHMYLERLLKQNSDVFNAAVIPYFMHVFKKSSSCNSDLVDRWCVMFDIPCLRCVVNSLPTRYHHGLGMRKSINVLLATHNDWFLETGVFLAEAFLPLKGLNFEFSQIKWVNQRRLFASREHI